MEHFDIGELQAARRESAERSMRPASIVEVRETIDRIFEGHTSHPWFATCQTFIDENRQATAVRGELPDGVSFLFFPAAGRGMWFKVGEKLEAVGRIGPSGARTLAEIAAAKHLGT